MVHYFQTENLLKIHCYSNVKILIHRIKSIKMFIHLYYVALRRSDLIVGPPNVRKVKSSKQDKIVFFVTQNT